MSSQHQMSQQTTTGQSQQQLILQQQQQQSHDMSLSHHYRQAPPPPLVPPQAISPLYSSNNQQLPSPTQQSSGSHANRPLPALPQGTPSSVNTQQSQQQQQPQYTSANSSKNESIMSTPPPPQVPQRNFRPTLRHAQSNSSDSGTQPIVTVTTTRINQHMQTSSGNWSMSNPSTNTTTAPGSASAAVATSTGNNGNKINNNQFENATNEAARLVYKSVMMGSVQSLNNNNNNNNNNPNNFNTGQNVDTDHSHHHLNQQSNHHIHHIGQLQTGQISQNSVSSSNSNNSNNNNNNNVKSHHVRNVSISDKTNILNSHNNNNNNKPQVYNIAGVVSNVAGSLGGVDIDDSRKGLSDLSNDYGGKQPQVIVRAAPAAPSPHMASNTIISGIKQTNRTNPGSPLLNNNNYSNNNNNSSSSHSGSSQHSHTNINSHANSLPWLLLNGETIDQNEPLSSEITFVMPDNRTLKGKLYISNFRLYFRSHEPNITNQNQSNIIIDLPLGLINRIEKIGHQSSKTNFYGLVISCKNGRRLRFANTHDRNSRRQIYEIIQRHAFPLNHNLRFFAFSYKQTFSENNGWNLYDAKQEYIRMGIKASGDWRFTDINMDYSFCDTYPSVLVVPKDIEDSDLRQIGEFRSKHRIPVVSWIKYDDKTYRAALLRSSQPLVGITKKRNDKDEAYLAKIFKLNSNNSEDKLFIVDARPLVNAVANITTGGGYENDDHYTNCEMLFLNIQNIHVMRESLRKIFDMAMPSIASSNSSSSSGASGAILPNSSNQLVGGNAIIPNTSGNQNQAISSSSNGYNFNDDKNYLINLENSKWLEHIRLILNGALKIVRYISQHRASVLVHCSDGWDRTAQLTSLSMLMMDKYYRTLIGFEILIEKEWLSFGHRFGIRMGHGSDKHSDQDRSPVFLQFIDCVWQILQQNGKVFEFNEKFLLAIVQNMYTCQFGTFLYNNEREREAEKLKHETVSLWSYINSYHNEFKNSSFVEYDGVVEFSSSLSSLQLWNTYYFQYKDYIDDSMNDSLITNYSQINRHNNNQQNSNRLTNISISSNLSVPPQSKNFGQAFFQKMVNEMKSSVRSYTQQEPELIRYRASVQQSDICN